MERAGDYQGARAQTDGPAPRRPLLGVCAAVAAGTLAGGLGTSGLWMAASLACLALWRSRPGPWLMLFCLAGLRAGAATVGPVDPTAGVWSDLRHGERTVGRLHPAGPAWSVTPGLIVPGERVWLLGDDPPARLARGPVAARTRAALPRRVLPDQVLRLSPASERPTARLARALVIVRAAALERLEALSDPRTRGLCRALLLGERGALDPRLTDLFTRTGTRHVLAVSGMHVGLVALIFVWPAGSALALLAARGRPWRAGTWAPSRSCSPTLTVITTELSTGSSSAIHREYGRAPCPRGSQRDCPRQPSVRMCSAAAWS